jgi:hypothetical protein
MSASPQQQMSRVQKLRWYVDQLMKDASELEQKGGGESAVSKYLQAADILLLLSKGEESYTTWKSYTDKASFCQQRAKRLIALAPKGQIGPA